jgi:hypothetical protein
MKQDLDLKLHVKQILALIQKVAPSKTVELRILRSNTGRVQIIGGAHPLMWSK